VKNYVLTAAVALSALMAGQAYAQQKYTFALVPKNMNNPFFDQARDGCKKAEAEANGAFECMYIGPGEHGGGEEQVQIVQDLVAKGVAGIAVSPSNAAAMAGPLQQAKAAGIPVLTWDSDLLPENKDLRTAYVGTKNYDIGVNLAKIVMQIKPKGGTICIQSGGAAAANHNERMQGIRDTLSGKQSAASPGDRLNGENGWKEADGCPLYTDDDFPRSVAQLEDTLAKYPDLDAFVPTGRYAARADGADEGRPVQGPGRSASLRDGLQVDVLPEGPQGRQVGHRSDLYRPRCLHAGNRRQLHRQITQRLAKQAETVSACFLLPKAIPI
jgi:ribose transport system substrate-binding protein